MAYTYTREDSPFIWIGYRSASGKRKQKKTGFLKSNSAQRKEAEKLAKGQTWKEQADAPTSDASFDWVPGWVEATWGHAPNGSTINLYRSYAERLRAYLSSIGVPI